MVIGGNG